MGLALFWLGLLFVEYRAGSLVDGAWVFEDPAWGVDLRAYLGAAQRVVDEGSPYAADLTAGSFEPGPEDLYYYAPQLSVALIPLLEPSFHDSSALWWALRVAGLLAACALMPVSLPLRAAAFAVAAFSLPGVKDPIIGNVSLLLLLPLVAGWRWLDRPLGSIALAAAISVRPSLGLLLLWQLLRRRWRAAVWTAAAGLALVLLTLPFVGLGGYVDYLAVLSNLSVPTGVNENRDLGALAENLGTGATGTTIGRLASIGLAAGATLLSLRRDREIGYMVVLSASLLVTPLLWSHYLATLVIPAAFLAQRLWKPLILLPLLSWLPILAPLLVVLTMALPFLVTDRDRSAASVPAGATA